MRLATHFLSHDWSGAPPPSPWGSRLHKHRYKKLLCLYSLLYHPVCCCVFYFFGVCVCVALYDCAAGWDGGSASGSEESECSGRQGAVVGRQEGSRRSCAGLRSSVYNITHSLIRTYSLVLISHKPPGADHYYIIVLSILFIYIQNCFPQLSTDYQLGMQQYT